MLETKCGCVILNYNSGKQALSLAEKMISFSSVKTVVIVDNKSTDNSMEILGTNYNNGIAILQSPINGGYAKGNNIGIRKLLEDPEIKEICITNPDIEIEENVFETIISTAGTCDSLGLISCDFRTDYQHVPPSGWELPTIGKCIMEQLPILGKIISNNKQCQVTGIEQFDVLVGSFFVADRCAIEKVGLFDEDTFLYFEENILAYKLKQEGYKNYIIHGLYYYHSISDSIEQTYKKYSQRAKLVYNSRKVYCKKYLRSSMLTDLLLFLSYKVGCLEIGIYNKVRKLK